MEEIYPPKLTEFAYVTDGACTDEDLLDMEKILLMVITQNNNYIILNIIIIKPTAKNQLIFYDFFSICVFV